MDIPSKESLTVEFKSDTTGNASKHGVDESLLVEAVVAMFNSEGGVLYLGVEDDGTPTGLNRKHADPVGLAALLANKTMPPIRSSLSSIRCLASKSSGSSFRRALSWALPRMGVF